MKLRKLYSIYSSAARGRPVLSPPPGQKKNRKKRETKKRETKKEKIKKERERKK